MQHLSELVLNDLQQHDATYALESTARRTRTRSEEHTNCQYHPCNVGPYGRVVGKQTRCGDERHHMEQSTSHCRFKFITVLPHQLKRYKASESKHHKQIESALSTLQKRAGLALRHGNIEHREVDARYKTEEGDNVLHYRSEITVVVMGGKSARGSRCEAVVDATEKVHTGTPHSQHAQYSDTDVYHPYPLGIGTEARMQLGLDRSGCFCSEHLDTSAYKRRQKGYREEYNTKSAKPLRERTPKQNAVRQNVYVVYYGSSGSGKSRHRLEESVGKGVQIASQKERKRSEQRENRPRQRYHKIGVTTREGVVAVAGKQSQHQSGARRYCHRQCKSHKVVLVIIHRNAKTQQQHHSLDEQQRPYNLIYKFQIYHRKNFSIFFMLTLWQNTITESPG